MSDKKFGFVSICGVPNVGKSTLLNYMIGEKVAATSNKPQTTRFSILATNEFGNTQIAFVDTPGIFKPKNNIDKLLRKSSLQSIKGADILLIVVDVSSKKHGEDFHTIEMLIDRYGELDSKFFLIFNKIDKIKSHELMEKVVLFEKYKRINEFFMISAETGKNIDVLKEKICESLPKQNWMYPPKSEMKKDIKRWASELTMEQIFKHLNQEIPYKTYVEPLHIEESEDGLHIYQNIVISKANYKPIIVGKRGQMLKSIGMASRLDIARNIKRRVHLHLLVKVVEKWESKQDSLKSAGLLE